MDNGTERKAAFPGHCQVSNVDSCITFSLLLTPPQQLTGPSHRLCNRGGKKKKKKIRLACKIPYLKLHYRTQAKYS